MAAMAKDAASLLVLRDGPTAPQIYMVRRHPANRFMANALVFVGGRLDEADAAPEMLACCTGLGPEQAARRLGMDPAQATLAMGLHVTAIRECFEESGLLLARRLDPADPPSGAELAAVRGLLLAGRAGLAQLCQHHDLRLLLDELRFWDRWITPELEPRRFDARFFVCRVPQGQVASFDQREATLGGWLSAEQALQEHREGRQLLAPPTLTILERLRGFSTVGDLLAAAPGPVGATQPRLLPGTGQPVLLLPGDHRYHDLASSSGPEHYVTLEEGRWRRICKGAE